jgi:hypothetical protein
MDISRSWVHLLIFYLPAYWQTEGVAVVGGATGAKHGGEAVRALSPPALAPKRGTPNTVAMRAGSYLTLWGR